MAGELPQQLFATNLGAGPTGGDAHATSSAIGGGGGLALTENIGGALFAGTGGDANATSDAASSGSGSASAAVTAFGGAGGDGGDSVFGGAGGAATATASATALGGGAATAKATATGGAAGTATYGPIGEGGSANATSNAEAEFRGVSVKSTVVASSPPSDVFVPGTASASAFSIALPTRPAPPR